VASGIVPLQPIAEVDYYEWGEQVIMKTVGRGAETASCERERGVKREREKDIEGVRQIERERE